MRPLRLPLLALLLAAAAFALVAYFARDEHGQPVKSASANVAKSLPNSLVVRPGRYALGGLTYDMRREGYHRLGRRQRVVYRHSLAALMSGLSWSTTSSGRDDASRDKILRLLTERRLGVSCGPFVEVVAHVLDQQGIRARTVGTLSKELDQPHPAGQEPGLDHVMLEIQVRGRWQLWDPYNRGRPLVKGRPTTVMEWTRPRSDRRLKTIARPDDNVVPEQLTPFYRRHNYMPLVATPGQTFPFYFTDPPGRRDPAQRRRVRRYRSGLYYLPRKEFMARFYPGQRVGY